MQIFLLYIFWFQLVEFKNTSKYFIWKKLYLHWMWWVLNICRLSHRFHNAIDKCCCSLIRIQLLGTQWTAAHQAFLSLGGFTVSQRLFKLMSIESVIPSNNLLLCRSFLLLPSILCLLPFRVVSNELAWLFQSGGQSIGASYSAWVLPVNIQGWFSLGLTVLISLQSKGLSRVFSSTIVQKHQFVSAQPSLWSNFHIHTWLLEKL